MSTADTSGKDSVHQSSLTESHRLGSDELRESANGGKSVRAVTFPCHDIENIIPIESRRTPCTTTRSVYSTKRLIDDCVRWDSERGTKLATDRDDTFKVNKEAVRFGMRLSIILTISTGFLFWPDFPQASWVYVTVVLTSWFPSSLDAASVLKKTTQRIMGTTIGSSLGMIVGLIVMEIPDVTGKAVFLSLSVAVITFTWAFMSVQWKATFAPFDYASVLVLMTFGIVAFPFYQNPDNNENWKVGCHRILNIVIGCFISGAGSILIWPKTTTYSIEEAVSKQITQAGEVSNAVLDEAYHVFSGKRQPNALRNVIKEARLPDMQKDPLHEKYAASVSAWSKTIALFSLLDYDPFYRLSCGNRSFNPQTAAMNVARAFRIQTTVILLDSIVRNDRGQKFSDEELCVFRRVGFLVERVLKVPLDETHHEYALELATTLAIVRQFASSAGKDLSGPAVGLSTALEMDLNLDEFVLQLSREDEGQPLCVKSATVLFLELVEHLILRSLRLYYVGIAHQAR